MGWFDSFKKEKRQELNENLGYGESKPADAPRLNIPEVIEPNQEEPAVDGAGASAAALRNALSGSSSPAADQTQVYDSESAQTAGTRDTQVIAILNQKGGVGKTTTAINLPACLGDMGKKILLIDFDPQGNATSGLGVEKSQLENCIYDVLLNDVPIEQAIVANVCEGLDLVPATINLAGAEVELVSEMARENRLQEAIRPIKGKYDYVFIDCPPSLGLLTVNALVATDKLIIPIQTEFYALEGVTKLLESMRRVKNRLNPSLDIFGILLTMYDGRTTLSRQVASEVRNYFGEQVFETIIPRTVKLSEAPSYGIPITQYDPLGKGAAAYVNLAKEVINRG